MILLEVLILVMSFSLYFIITTLLQQIMQLHTQRLQIVRHTEPTQTIVQTLYPNVWPLAVGRKLDPQ